MGRGWFICGGSSKDTVPRPPLRESEGDEVSVKPAAPAGEDDARILGPGPAPIPRLRGEFRFHVQLQAPRIEQLQDIASHRKRSSCQHVQNLDWA